MSVWILTSFLLYVITVACSVGMLGSLWTDFMSAYGASGRIFELLEKETEDIEKGKDKIETGRIEFKDVHFSYPSRPEFPVLRGVSFTMDSHETVAVVGSSGAGKSTLVQLLMSFYETNSGNILFDDQDSKSYSLKVPRESLGPSSQEPVIIFKNFF